MVPMKKTRTVPKITTGRFELDDPATKQLLVSLCKKSLSFHIFFRSNKENITALETRWAIDPRIKEKGSASPINNVITLQKYPVSKKDARIVAHEIEHLLIWNQGFPYVMANIRPDATRGRRGLVARALQALIYEPMVESQLKNYFEKICLEHQKNALKELNKKVKNKTFVLNEIASPYGLLYHSCIYIEDLRLMQVTCDNDESAEFIRLYKKHFGENIVPCADKIMALINEIGTNSPEAVKKIIETTLQNGKFKLTYAFQETFNRFVIDFASPPQ